MIPAPKVCPFPATVDKVHIDGVLSGNTYKVTAFINDILQTTPIVKHLPANRYQLNVVLGHVLGREKPDPLVLHLEKVGF